MSETVELPAFEAGHLSGSSPLTRAYGDVRIDTGAAPARAETQ